MSADPVLQCSYCYGLCVSRQELEDHILDCPALPLSDAGVWALREKNDAERTRFARQWEPPWRLGKS